MCEKAAKEVGRIIEAMGQCNITHGDMKHTNILMAENGPVITDLDAMVYSRWRWLYRLRRARDIERFSRDLRKTAK
jgi:tRNA A-37 threonylcarbamoyl transferase component Bud32